MLRGDLGRGLLLLGYQMVLLLGMYHLLLALFEICWTYELVRSDITSSLPLRRDTTHTWFTLDGSIDDMISLVVRSLAPSGASGISNGAA
jgi:hypothetical protein